VRYAVVEIDGGRIRTVVDRCSPEGAAHSVDELRRMGATGGYVLSITNDRVVECRPWPDGLGGAGKVAHVVNQAHPT
jgi:hypothetical protein